jgi:hypothetical protein
MRSSRTGLPADDASPARPCSSRSGTSLKARTVPAIPSYGAAARKGSGRHRDLVTAAALRRAPTEFVSTNHWSERRCTLAAVVTDTMKLALDLSRSAVQDQAARLSDLRTRAGTLLAAASISGSFLGVTHGTLDAVAVLALVAYLVSVSAAIYTLMPHRLSTEFRGKVLLDVSREAEATDEEAYEAAVGWLEVTRGENAGVLDDLTRWYVAAAVALGVEVVLWIVALTS